MFACYLQRASATFWLKLAIRQHTEPVINFIACASIFFTTRSSLGKYRAREHRWIFHSAIFPLPWWIAKPSPSGASIVPVQW